MSGELPIEVTVEDKENYFDRRMEAGLSIGLISIFMLIFGWVLLPIYILGYIGEKLDAVYYVEENEDDDEDNASEGGEDE